MAMDSPAVASEDLGVTRLAKTCGHVFCRKEYVRYLFCLRVQRNKSILIELSFFSLLNSISTWIRQVRGRDTRSDLVEVLIRCC